MSRNRELLGFLGKGFVLEVSGSPGSGRREAVYKIIDVLGGDAIYIDYAQTRWRSKGKWPGVEFITASDPLELLSATANANHSLMVVDSIPRVFHAFKLEYRARWGLVASLLALAVDRASRGLGSVFVNYWSMGRSFGEQVFAPYFTHRAVVRRDAGRQVLQFFHPLRGEVEL